MDRDPMEVAFSTDLVMDYVLSHLKVRDLLSCRLVSKCWNKSASLVLRRHSTMIRHITEEDLVELGKCMERSLDFPFAGLQFDEPWKFNSGCAMKFFENYGERFTRLCFFPCNCSASKLHDLAPFIDLVPRLSILEIGQSYANPSSWDEWSNSVVPQKSGEILKLPSLRTIRLISPSPEMNENVLREVLAAASRLRIEYLDAKPEILRVLKGAGRLRALSFISFLEDDGNQRFALEMDQLLSTESPSLTKLHFSSKGCVGLAGLKKMLYSSQTTLRELNLDGKYLSECWNKFPVLPKLTKLSLSLGREFWFFLQHCRHGQCFPALKEVDIGGWHEILPSSFSKGLFVVPSVTTIELHVYVSEFGMKQLAQSFPNVTEMRMNYAFYSGIYFRPLINTSEIWNVGEFKCLEKLKITNYMDDPPLPPLDYINMDSLLTGMPLETCENLRKQKGLDVVNSLDAEALRCNPSILKLESLKELVVCVEPAHLLKDTPFISIVSVKYALEMMPNLRTKFVYRNPSPYSFREKEFIAALEEVFKDVQPYAKLEGFFD